MNARGGRRVAGCVVLWALPPILARAAEDERLRPPHELLRMSVWQRHGPWVLGVVLLVGLVAWLVLRRRKRPQSAVTLPPAARARGRLEAWRGRPVDDALALDVAGVLREYLRERFLLRPIEFTTAELREQLADHPRCGPELAAAAHGILRACDERKFAPKVELGACALVEQALGLVDRLEAGPPGLTPDAGAPAVPAPAAERPA
jgi:hypothetical protein